MQPQSQTRTERKYIAELLDDLNSADLSKCEKAESTLRNRGQYGFEQLLHYLAFVSKYKVRCRLYLWGALGLYLVFVLFMVASGFGRHLNYTYGIGLILLFFCLTWERRRNKGTCILAEFRDVRAVGLLAEALSFRDKETCHIARKALMQLLPEMIASDAPLLNTTARENLNRVLTSDDVPFTHAILIAYQQVGDESALDVVERLTANAADKRVCAWAAECLPFLRNRAQQLRGSQTLLRASDCESSPDTLLRAATSGQNMDERQLVHPR